jgi:hypothetical protein
MSNTQQTVLLRLHRNDTIHITKAIERFKKIPSARNYSICQILSAFAPENVKKKVESLEKPESYSNSRTILTRAIDVPVKKRKEGEEEPQENAKELAIPRDLPFYSLSYEIDTYVTNEIVFECTLDFDMGNRLLEYARKELDEYTKARDFRGLYRVSLERAVHLCKTFEEFLDKDDFETFMGKYEQAIGKKYTICMNSEYGITLRIVDLGNSNKNYILKSVYESDYLHIMKKIRPKHEIKKHDDVQYV